MINTCTVQRPANPVSAVRAHVAIAPSNPADDASFRGSAQETSLCRGYRSLHPACKVGTARTNHASGDLLENLTPIHNKHGRTTLT